MCFDVARWGEVEAIREQTARERAQGEAEVRDLVEAVAVADPVPAVPTAEVLTTR